MINATILIIGFSGLIAQLVLLRELLVSFLGNELVIGIILSNWVLAEAVGVYGMGRLVEKARDTISMLFFLQLAFSLSLPAAVYFSRLSHDILGLGPGEAPGLWQGVWFSFLVIFPVAFSHGGLFSCFSKIASGLDRKEGVFSLSRMYAWETLGTMLGGFAFTYLFLVFFNSFLVAFLISLLNLVLTLIILLPSRKSNARFLLLCGILIILFSVLLNKSHHFELVSAGRQFKNAELVDYRNSPHGTIAVTKIGEQYTFFYNGLPVITTPNPDLEFIEEFSHIPLLFHNAPVDILVIGGGTGGFLSEILKYQEAKVTYIELDPLIIQLLKKYPTALTAGELGDKRVNIVNQDGRYYLKNSAQKYDLIFIGFSGPSELSINRFFTTEFFHLASMRLNSNGIISFYLPGSLSYIGEELKEINGSILNSLHKVYPQVRVIPGDFTIFMASPGVIFDSQSAEELIRKKNALKIQTKLISLPHLRYRLDKKWEQWFGVNLKTATSKENKDLSPFAVYGVMRLWDKQLSGQVNRWKLFLFPALVLIFIAWILLVRKPYERVLGYVLATTGFFGMLMSLVLILCFEVFNGYLYRQIGLIISFFMAGSALGGFIISRLRPAVPQGLNLLVRAEAAVMIATLVIAVSIFKFSDYLSGHGFIFYLFSFMIGFLVGLEFALASLLFRHKGSPAGQASGFLYASDLIGSYGAGIAGMALFLPLWGVGGCFLALVLLKLSAFVLLIYFGLKRRFFL